MAEEYQQTIATAQVDGKVVGVEVVGLMGKEDDQKFQDVEDVQAMTKMGEGEKVGCDTSDSDSKSGSDSKSDSVSSKSNSVSSKSNSDSDSKSASDSGTSTLKEKERIKRKVQKVKLSKKLAEKGEKKIGMITKMDVNKDGAEETKLLEEGDEKLCVKLQCDSSDSGSKSGSVSGSKSGLVVDLMGKEDDKKFHDEIIGCEKVDVEDVQAMTKVGDGEKVGCDTSDSDSKSGSDSKSDSVSSKSNSVSSKSNSDSDSKSGSDSGTSTLKEKERIKRKVQKVKLSKKLSEKEEEKIGMVTKMDVNKDGAKETKLLEEGDDKLHDKLQCDSSDSGSKSGSDSSSKSGSNSGSKSGSSTINVKAKRSITKGLKKKIKEKTCTKIVKEDQKNDLLISLEANKSDDKETKMVEEGDENKQQSMLKCDSSDSGSKSGSDSGSKSGSDSASKSSSITIEEKGRTKKIRRKGLKENIKKLNGLREEENKIGLVTAFEFNEDKMQEVGEGAMDKKINILNKPLCDSSNSGFKYDSDIGLGLDMTVIVEKLEEPMKMEGSLEEKTFLEKLKEKLPSYHKNVEGKYKV